MTDLPLWKQVVAGGSAGVAEILIMYPTDVAKTQAQLHTGGQLTMLQSLRKTVAERGVSGLYRGLASPIVAEAPKRAVKFSCNEQYKGMLRGADGSLSSGRAGLAGSLAGTTEAFVNCPFETVKVRMQAADSTYASTAACARSIIQTEGLFKIYAGLEPLIWRNAVWNGAYFMVIGTVANMLPTAPDATRAERLSKKFASGLVGSCLGTLLNTPFDVVKSRMQNQRAGSTKYTWTLPSLKTVLQEEGFRALYKGLGPRLVRLGPGGGIMIVAFDTVASWLR